MFKDLQSAIDSTLERYANTYLDSVSETFANTYLDLALEWSQLNPDKVKALLDIVDLKITEFAGRRPYIDRFLLELNSQTVLKNRIFSYIIDGERQFILPLLLSVSVEKSESSTRIIDGDGSRRWVPHTKIVISIVWFSSVEFDINPDGSCEVLDAFFDALKERARFYLSAHRDVITVDDIQLTHEVITTK